MDPLLSYLIASSRSVRTNDGPIISATILATLIDNSELHIIHIVWPDPYVNHGLTPPQTPLSYLQQLFVVYCPDVALRYCPEVFCANGRLSNTLVQWVLGPNLANSRAKTILNLKV